MTVHSLEAKRQERVRTHQQNALRELHENVEAVIDQWHHGMQRAPVLRDVLYAWHRFEFHHTPEDDELLNGFLLTLTPAVNMLGMDLIIDICRQHYIDDDTRCWFIVEGLTQIMGWSMKYPGYPLQADAQEYQLFLQQNFEDMVAYVIEKLGGYYQEFLPNFSVARCLRIRQHNTLNAIT